jgi:hypothetical protein
MTKRGEFVFISEKYLVEIITGVKLAKDDSLMSFKRLFDSEVKLLIILVVILVYYLIFY